jgi:hypothetical protein
MKKTYVTFELSIVSYESQDVMIESTQIAGEEGVDFGAMWGNN